MKTILNEEYWAQTSWNTYYQPYFINYRDNDDNLSNNNWIVSVKTKEAAIQIFKDLKEAKYKSVILVIQTPNNQTKNIEQQTISNFDELFELYPEGQQRSDAIMDWLED